MKEFVLENHQAQEESKARYNDLHEQFHSFKKESLNNNTSEMDILHIKNLFLQGTCTIEGSIRTQALQVLFKALDFKEED